MRRKLFIILLIIAALVAAVNGCRQKLDSEVDSEGKDLDCFPGWLIVGEGMDNHPEIPLLLTNSFPPSDGVCKFFPWNLP
jgi:hypothetical protein